MPVGLEVCCCPVRMRRWLGGNNRRVYLVAGEFGPVELAVQIGASSIQLIEANNTASKWIEEDEKVFACLSYLGIPEVAKAGD